MLTAEDLNKNDDDGLDGLKDSSSMQHLPSALSFSALIRGNESLGARMDERGLDAVPSPDNPGPGNGIYFSGKDSYVAKTYRDQANVVGLYIPTHICGHDDNNDDHGDNGNNRNKRSDDEQDRDLDSCVSKRTVKKLARAIIDYYTSHYG